MHACVLLLLCQVEVETLRYTLTDLQETCAQAETSSSSSSSRGLQAATKAQSSSIELPTIAPPGVQARATSAVSMCVLACAGLPCTRSGVFPTMRAASILCGMVVYSATQLPACLPALPQEPAAAAANTPQQTGMCTMAGYIVTAATDNPAAVYRGYLQGRPSGTASLCSHVAGCSTRVGSATAAAAGRRCSSQSSNQRMNTAEMIRRLGGMAASATRPSCSSRSGGRTRLWTTSPSVWTESSKQASSCMKSLRSR